MSSTSGITHVAIGEHIVDCVGDLDEYSNFLLSFDDARLDHVCPGWPDGVAHTWRALCDHFHAWALRRDSTLEQVEAV